MSAPTPAQAAANAFVTGCVKRGLSAAQASVPPEGQLATVRGLWADVAQAAIAAREAEPAPGPCPGCESLRRQHAETCGEVGTLAAALREIARRTEGSGQGLAIAAHGIARKALDGLWDAPEPAPELAAAIRASVVTEIREAANCDSDDGDECGKCNHHADAILAAVKRAGLPS